MMKEEKKESSAAAVKTLEYEDFKASFRDCQMDNQQSLAA